MNVRLGDHTFDDVVYDAAGDVLYMHKGEPVPATSTFATPEGHAVMRDDAGAIIGVTIVNARWLAERDGRVTVTLPDTAAPPGRLETSADELAPALSG